MASVVGAYYYLRIIKIMYFDEPTANFDKMDAEVQWVIYAAGAFTVLFAVFAQPLLSLALTAAQALL